MKSSIIAIAFFTLINNLSATDDCNPEQQFSCDDGRCIALNDVCDGIQQCANGLDEQDCEFRERDAKYEGLPRQENMLLSDWESELRIRKEKKVELLSGEKKSVYRSHKWQMLIIIVFIILCAFIVWIAIQRKRRRKSRALRNDDTVEDDEDDLLISSMYAS
uniref:Low-density lipoprotein receptor domain class A n=1 Tax=Syphacia muris TaxID=451379 RepID=A0A0N5ABW1_9BILA